MFLSVIERICLAVPERSCVDILDQVQETREDAAKYLLCEMVDLFYEYGYIHDYSSEKFPLIELLIRDYTESRYDDISDYLHSNNHIDALQFVDSFNELFTLYSNHVWHIKGYVKEVRCY